MAWTHGENIQVFFSSEYFVHKTCERAQSALMTSFMPLRTDETHARACTIVYVHIHRSAFARHRALKLWLWLTSCSFLTEIERQSGCTKRTFFADFTHGSTRDFFLGESLTIQSFAHHHSVTGFLFYSVFVYFFLNRSASKVSLGLK